MSFPKSTTMRNPKIAPRLPMARCAGFHYRLLAAVETRIGPILKLDSKAVPDKLQGKGVSGRLLNWRHHPLRYVSREEETMGLTNLPSTSQRLWQSSRCSFLVTKLVSAINSLYSIDG